MDAWAEMREGVGESQIRDGAQGWGFEKAFRGRVDIVYAWLLSIPRAW